MSRPQPTLNISKNDSQFIKNIRDTKPLFDKQYKRAVALLEMEKGTPGIVIARELGLRPNTIIDIRKRYEKLGLNSLDENLPRKAYIKEPIDEKLKQLIEKSHDEGKILTQEDMAAELNCSPSTVARAIKRNNIKIEESGGHCDPSLVSLILDGYIICAIYLTLTCGYIILFSNNDDLKKYSKIIINRRKAYYNSKEGMILFSQAFDKLYEFNGGYNYSVDSNLSLKDIIESKDALNGEFIAISYGNNEDLENYKIKNLKLDSVDSFLKSLSFYFKSCDINKDLLGKKVLDEIKKAVGNLKENRSFTWRMSDNHKPFRLDKTKEEVEGDNKTKISITIKYESDGKTLERTYTKNINPYFSGAIQNPKSINEFLTGLGRVDESLIEMGHESARDFEGELVNELTSNNKKKQKTIKVETLAGRYNARIPTDSSSQAMPHQIFYTPEMLITIVEQAKNVPFKQAADNLNKFLYREEIPISEMTINDLIRTLGKVYDDIDTTVETVLETNNYDKKTGKKIDDNEQECQSPSSEFHQKELKKAVINYIIYHNSRDPYTQIPYDVINQLEYDPLKTIYISVDDVFVTHQKESRSKNKNSKKTKYVSHTNVSIKYAGGKYYMTAKNTFHACLMILAFLIKNNLLRSYQLVFTFDGAREIRRCINSLFVNLPIKPLFRLDWFHLCKRINEISSMALHGGRKKFDENNKIKGRILKFLWYGKIDQAIEVINNIAKDKIKNKGKIEELLRYINDRREYMCCYALRKRLHLINSSNAVETANCLIVTKRQKHNGYSWGEKGSRSLATLTTLFLNNQLNQCLIEGKIEFVPVPHKGDFWSVPKNLLDQKVA